MVKACVWPFVILLNMWGWPNPLLCVISVMWTLSRLNSEARMDLHFLTHCMHKKYTFVWSIVMPNIVINNLIWLDECQTFQKAPPNKEFTFESKLFVRRCFLYINIIIQLNQWDISLANQSSVWRNLTDDKQSLLLLLRKCDWVGPASISVYIWLDWLDYCRSWFMRSWDLFL